MSQDERLMTVIQTDTKTDLTDNAYFIHHPERIVHTTAKLDADPYGKPAMVYLHEGKAAGIAGDLRRMLDKDFHYRLAMRLYSGTIRNTGSEEKAVTEKEAEHSTVKLEGLEGLKGQIPGMLDISVRTDYLPTSTVDVMLDTTFEDADALAAYVKNPKHVAVADTKVRPFTANRACMDFEV